MKKKEAFKPRRPWKVIVFSLCAHVRPPKKTLNFEIGFWGFKTSFGV